MSQAPTLKDAVHLFPDSAKSMVAMLGAENALRVIECFEGISYDIPSGQGRNARNRLAEALGSSQLADRMICLYGGERVYFPSLNAARLALRDWAIHNEVEAAYREGVSSTQAVSTLAKKYGLSDRRIWLILKKPTSVLCEGQH